MSDTFEAIKRRLRAVPPERTTAEERLQAVRDRAVLVALLADAQSNHRALIELAREMMLELEVHAPAALRDIPRRILARTGR